MSYFIKQLYKDDCLFACFKILLSLFSKNKKYLRLENSHLSGNYNFLEIINEGNKYGLNLNGYKVDDFKTLKTSLPLIAEVNEKNNHAIVITKIKNDKVYYLDPSIGRCVKTINDFIKIFTGNILKVEKYQKKRNKVFNSIELFFNTYGIILLTINILMIVLSYCFSLINSSYFIGVIFFLILIFVLNQIVVLIFDKWFDQKFIKKIILNEKFHSQEYYQQIYTYKTHSLQTITGLTNLISIILYLIILTIINVPYLLPFILLTTVIDIISLIFNNKIDVNKLNQLEKNLLDEKQQLNRKNIIYNIDKIINKYKLLYVILQIIKFLIIGLSIILLCMWMNNFTLNYGLFYFFLLNSLTSSITKLISLLNKKEEYTQKLLNFKTIFCFYSKKNSNS